MNILPFDFTATISFSVITALLVSGLILLISWWMYSDKNFYKPKNKSFFGFIKFGLVIYLSSSIVGIAAILIVKIIFALVYGLVFGFEGIITVVNHD